jgi:putative hydrolase of the HAD superfamily
MAKTLVVFDGDNTLWRTEVLYDRAAAAFKKYMAEHGADPDEANAWMQKHDVELAKEMGYSMHRYPRSMRDAALHFLGDAQHGNACAEIGYGVFKGTAEPEDGSEEVIEALRSGRTLCILTAGEPTVQEKRILDFPSWGRFAATRIVEKKTKDTFLALAGEMDADPKDSWVIGDSLRSDIIPGREAGFRAVLFNTHNWAAYEKAGHELPEGVACISSLRELPRLLAAA